jgi:hypothetical protein
MAVGIIDTFEVIQIAQNHDRATLLAKCSHQFAFQQIHNGAAVQEESQVVVSRFKAQGLASLH